MATIFPLDRNFKITTDANGAIAELGAAGVMQQVGTFGLQFVPSQDFQGFVAIVARMPELSNTTSVPDAPFMAYPYRAAYLNGAVPAVPFGFVLDAATNLPPTITGPSMIQVPSNGFSVGLLISCTAGSMWVYLARLNGPSAV